MSNPTKPTANLPAAGGLVPRSDTMQIEITPFARDGHSSEKAKVRVAGAWLLTIMFWEEKYHVLSRQPDEHPDSKRITAPMKERSFRVRGAVEKAVRTAITDFYQSDRAAG
ncbi:MAG: hypothetical protein OXC13_15875 [Caldilineaceae bacterium]|nr:hypothetical protein [Caldilineaceae bacterium]